MVVGVGTSASLTGLPTQSFVDQTLTGAQTTAQTGQSSNVNQNQYNQGQLGVQGQLGSFISNILSGNVPQGLGLPQSVWDAAHQNFNTFQAPKIAAVNGEGSPAIASAAQQQDIQLAGLAGQRAIGNSLDAFGQAAQFAFRPIGNTANQTQSANGNQFDNTAQHTTQTNVDYGGLLSAVGQLLGGGFQPVNIFP